MHRNSKKIAVTLMSLLFFPLIVFSQIRIMPSLGFSTLLVNPLKIDHNPLGKTDNIPLLQSKAAIGFRYDLGFDVNFSKKLSLHTGLGYARLPYVINFEIYPSSPVLPGDELITLKDRSDIVRYYSFPFSFKYHFFEQRFQKIKNAYLEAGVSVDYVKTFRSTTTATMHYTDTFYLLFKKILVDPPDYQTERDDKLFKIFLSYRLKAGITFNKPLSTLALCANYTPQKVGFGAFEFYHLNHSSEGYLIFRNKSIGLEYKYYLANLRQIRFKRKQPKEIE